MKYSLVEINNITHFKEDNYFYCDKTKTVSKEKIICPDCLNKLQLMLESFDCYQKDKSILMSIFSEIFHSAYVAKGSNRSNMDKTCYKFIPLNVNAVLNTFNELRTDKFKNFYRENVNKEFNPHSFIDAGCGIGNIMLIARNILIRAEKNKDFPPIQGIDFDPVNIKKAKIILDIKHPYQKDQYKLIKGDIRTFKHYNKYDVIYFYVPLIEREELYKFLDNVYTTAKPGTVIIHHGANECSANLWREIKDNFVSYAKNNYVCSSMPIRIKLK